ncbi:MAG: 2-C-methyl-D-erythritol 4-phosphate cytidylyltransferase [Mycoplasmataceae bacterium]|nr:2-C-methyl-D-erythritol 4-phosphate cytidylyltransferase [Mycoplasmataceae bacterium]
MTYGIILAAGIGERFKKTPIKPLFLIKGKPLFLYTVDTFLDSQRIDKILLVINQKFKKQFQGYLASPKYRSILICDGDQRARWKSLIKAMDYLSSHCVLKPNDIIVSHDAARINLTTKIINDNILVTNKYGYASTVLPLHDSIMEFKDQALYLERTHKYIVQTPQTFQYKFWKKHQIKVETDVTDLFTYLKLKINQSNLVTGNLLNFKITTIEDLQLI